MTRTPEERARRREELQLLEEELVRKAHDALRRAELRVPSAEELEVADYAQPSVEGMDGIVAVREQGGETLYRVRWPLYTSLRDEQSRKREPDA